MARCRAFTLTHAAAHVAGRGPALTPSPRVRGEGRGEGASRLGSGFAAKSASLRQPVRSESRRGLLTLGRFAPSTSPARRGEVKRHRVDNQSRSRDANASELCLRPRTKNRFAPGNKREAKRRKAHANHVPPRKQVDAVCATHLRSGRLRALSGRARLPALRPRLSQGLPSLLSSRPCFLGLGQRMIRKSGYRFSEKIMRS